MGTVHDAIHVYTMDAAYVDGIENLVRSIEPGRLADLTVLNLIHFETHKSASFPKRCNVEITI
ncbi:MAG: hypothetical protein KGS46_15285 [Chloroflexi bacterium]|jgi:predicted amidohydrolase YtcJ|nr:hypothetical protein [Chloroflexota bacterium]